MNWELRTPPVLSYPSNSTSSKQSTLVETNTYPTSYLNDRSNPTLMLTDYIREMSSRTSPSLTQASKSGTKRSVLARGVQRYHSRLSRNCLPPEIGEDKLNIEEYVAKFSSLLRFAPHIADNEEAKADQFINDLNLDVFTLVNTVRPTTLAEALNRSKGVESGLLRQRRTPFEPQPFQQVPSTSQTQLYPILEGLAVTTVGKRLSSSQKENSSSEMVVLPLARVDHKKVAVVRLLGIVEIVEGNTIVSNAEECSASVIETN
ncbi:hypothetical protein F511_41044 [Dorcoceras hygrometricum]|uniref:Uncharacterized protein n=1 Tax=Dorcoceras hygrometricum TaxID=472368 RepID=A0A2Z7C8I1_9LAMI|nr:hypothetical protein F511_41044 [Dorcoceras hygrometricum]